MKTRVNKPIICADGFKMSVQAHTMAHSMYDPEKKRYTHVEVGYPSQFEPLLQNWAEDKKKPTETVYGFVPVERVALVCAKHGGVVSGELPEGVVRLDPVGS